jgi:hypothetical protein
MECHRVLCWENCSLYIKDLPMSVTHDSEAILFADNTSILVTVKNYTSFKQKMNLALTSLDQWFTTNQLVLNITKTNVIKFTSKTAVHVPLDISFTDNVLDEVNSTKFFGIHIDNHMNWKTHIEQISHKLNAACFTIRNVTHTLNADILRTFNQYFSTE